MTFESFLSAHLENRLRHRRVLVVHDPEQRFRSVVMRLGDNFNHVLDCGGDLLEAREMALESFAALGEDGTWGVANQKMSSCGFFRR